MVRISLLLLGSGLARARRLVKSRSGGAFSRGRPAAEPRGGHAPRDTVDIFR